MTDLRSRFSRVLQRNEIYLANHSLGRPLDQTAGDVREALDLWYADMDAAWDAWLAEMNSWRGNVARLIGLPGLDAIAPKTSAGQGLRAVLNSFPQDRPVRVLTTTGEFDSIDFILKTYAAAGRAEAIWVEPTSPGSVPLFEVGSLVERLVGEPGLVVVSLVFFGTAQILQDAQEMIEAAHERGWLVLLDLYHAAGVIPVDVESLDADFAIGGSYKYLRGGSGACWLAVHPRHFGRRTLDTGWFAKKDKFDYARPDPPQFAEGGDSWLESTLPILMPYQARAGLGFTLEMGVDRLRAESLAQQARMREAFRRRGVHLVEPEDPTRFGAFSLLHHDEPFELADELKRRRMNVDARGQFVRFGPDVLNTVKELGEAADIVADALT